MTLCLGCIVYLTAYIIPYIGGYRQLVILKGTVHDLFNTSLLIAPKLYKHNTHSTLYTYMYTYVR